MQENEGTKLVITAKLLQMPSVEIEGKQVSFHLKKAEAVFYYLLVEKKASRQELASLLWPEEDSVQAHRHLRDSLYFIKKYLHPGVVIPLGRTGLTLNPEMDFICDTDLLLQKKELKAGNFLQGFDPGGSAEYESWMERTREKFSTIYLESLSGQADEAEKNGDFETSVRCILDCIREDPLSEDNYRRLMQVYRRGRAYSKAAFVYQKLKTILADELGIAPLEETSALYREIMNEWNARTDESGKYGNDFLVARYEIFRHMSSDLQLIGQGVQKAVLLQGEAGVGKTHLLQYFLRHADLEAVTVITSSCYPSKMNEFLHPWQTVMLAVSSAAVKGELDVPPAVFHALPGNPGFWSEGMELGEGALTYNPGSIYETIITVLNTAAQKQKLLLVFEDIHWMDQASLQLLDQAVRRTGNAKLSFLMTCRETAEAPALNFITDFLNDRLIKKYDLPPFNREETMQLIEQFGAGDMEADLKERVHTSAGGNAFLIVQLLNSLIEQQNRKILPGMVKEIFSYRMAGVSQEGRQVLNLISMFPESAPYEILERLSNKPPLELLYLCLELRQRSIINEISDGGSISLLFIQPEFRDRVYLSIRPLNRRILHLNIAQLLEGMRCPGKNSQLLYHYTQGGDRMNSFKYKVKDLQNQITLYYELLPSRDADDELGLDTAAGALQLLGEMEEALSELLNSGQDKNKYLEIEEELLYAKCRYCIYKGFYEHGISAAEHLWNRGHIARETSMGLHKQMIYFGIQTCDTDFMACHLDKGIREAELSGNRKEQVVFERLRGVLLLKQKKYALSRTVLHQALESLRNVFGNSMEFAAHASYVLNYIGETYREQEEYALAEPYYEKAIQAAREFGAAPGLPIFYTNYGSAVFAAGDYNRAEKLFAEAVKTASCAREPAGRAVALAYQGLFSLIQGETDKSVRLFRQAEGYAAGWKSPVEQGTVRLLLAWGCRYREADGAESLMKESDAYIKEAKALFSGREGAVEKKIMDMCVEGVYPPALFLRRKV